MAQNLTLIGRSFVSAAQVAEKMNEGSFSLPRGVVDELSKQLIVLVDTDEVIPPGAVVRHLAQLPYSARSWARDEDGAIVIAGLVRDNDGVYYEDQPYRLASLRHLPPNQVVATFSPQDDARHEFVALGDSKKFRHDVYGNQSQPVDYTPMQEWEAALLA